ncbi:MAG: NADH dehydrogenase [Alphaproteobacteria bacterium]|jgi:NADH dehydrogenase
MIETNKIVTVIGGSGFVGRYIVQRLAKMGMRVRVAVRNPSHAHDLVVSGTVGQVVPVQCNIRNFDSVSAAIDGADYVVNCVGILYETSKQTFEKTQYEGAKNIAQACKAHNIEKLVHISAIGANEKSKSTYAKTKAQAEVAILDLMPNSTILRPSIIFGAEDNFFNLFARLASLSPILPLVGGGSTLFQPVYVDDVAQAVTYSLENTQTNGKIYELGGVNQYSFKQLMEKMLFQIGKKRLLVPMPFLLAKFKAFFLQLLPKPLLTIDQVELLKYDNIVARDALTFKDLSIRPTDIDIILPTYLRTYRKAGDYDLGTGFNHKTGRNS